MKKIFITVIFALVALSAFAQSYKDFGYEFKRGNFDATMFERGLKGETNIPQDKIDVLVKLIQNGHITLYPNQNKVIWYADTVKQVMGGEGGNDFFEIMAAVCAVFCGNFKGNYLYWCEGWLTTDKKFFEYSKSWGTFELYEVW